MAPCLQSAESPPAGSAAAQGALGPNHPGQARISIVRVYPIGEWPAAQFPHSAAGNFAMPGLATARE